ncbi:hypothetical protein CDL15_Pgr004059 [Punica granatum]|uniref:Uncharacterized protein n=1 Tax=Punica granatum TaxID=22663 RepID=A0A218XFV3_PUNGR|nr:hypothetical protein CDL15_Pgr004059 [Punica granatum]
MMSWPLPSRYSHDPSPGHCSSNRQWSIPISHPTTTAAEGRDRTAGLFGGGLVPATRFIEGRDRAARCIDDDDDDDDDADDDKLWIIEFLPFCMDLEVSF